MQRTNSRFRILSVGKQDLFWGWALTSHKVTWHKVTNTSRKKITCWPITGASNMHVGTLAFRVRLDCEPGEMPRTSSRWTYTNLDMYDPILPLPCTFIAKPTNRQARCWATPAPKMQTAEIGSSTFLLASCSGFCVPAGTPLWPLLVREWHFSRAPGARRLYVNVEIDRHCSYAVNLSRSQTQAKYKSVGAVYPALGYVNTRTSISLYTDAPPVIAFRAT